MDVDEPVVTGSTYYEIMSELIFEDREEECQDFRMRRGRPRTVPKKPKKPQGLEYRRRKKHGQGFIKDRRLLNEAPEGWFEEVIANEEVVARDMLWESICIAMG